MVIEEKKLDENIIEERLVIEVNGMIEGGKDEKGGVDIMSGIEIKVGVLSGGSFKDKRKGEE